MQIEAGQYCTFAIHWDGHVTACGKGSYGRLGLGESSNQTLPKKILLDSVVKKLSSSKGELHYLLFNFLVIKFRIRRSHFGFN